MGVGHRLLMVVVWETVSAPVIPLWGCPGWGSVPRRWIEKREACCAKLPGNLRWNQTVEYQPFGRRPVHRWGYNHLGRLR